MKKVFFICLVGLFGISGTAIAQYSKGDNLLNLGIGVNSYYSGGIPLSASFEVGVTDEISVGAGLDYLTYRNNFSGTRVGFSAAYFGLRGSYHFSKAINLNVPELDLYGGASLGYRSFKWRDDYNGIGLGNVYSSSVFLGIFVGARYYFDPKVGAFLEAGAGGSSNARVGVAFKF